MVNHLHLNQWKVACFDLDGTLVRNTSTGHHLATKLGHADGMAVIESLYREGKASNSDVAQYDGQHYQGYSVTDIHHFLEDIPTINHIKQTVDYLSSVGIPSIICTLAWKFVAEYFANKYGFVDWSGPELVMDEHGLFTGEVLSDFQETDKPKFVNSFCLKRNVHLSEVFHVGDSRSDWPLFKAVGLSIALNAGTPTRALASHCINSESLMDVITTIPIVNHSPK